MNGAHLPQVLVAMEAKTRNRRYSMAGRDDHREETPTKRKAAAGPAQLSPEMLESLAAEGIISSATAPPEEIEAAVARLYACRVKSARERLANGTISEEQLAALLTAHRSWRQAAGFA